VGKKKVDDMVEVKGTVERVIGPETVEVKIGQKYETVNLIGIGVPLEMKDGALEYLNKEAQGKVATLKYYGEEYSPQIRKYGRIAAYMYIRNVLMNGGMIEKGVAIALSSNEFKENPYTKDVMVKLEAEAKNKSLGIWEKTKDKASIIIADNTDEVTNKVRKIIDESAKQTETTVKSTIAEGIDVIKNIIKNK
jgi:endonuclease YncB( thermonuclease family)